MSKLMSPIGCRKLQVGVVQFIELDATQDFMGELLEELNESVSPEERGEESFISFQGELVKMSGKYEEFMHLIGTLSTTYYTHDIFTNEVMTDSLEIEVKSLILTQDVSQKLHMQEEVDIELNGEEYDLYFLDIDDNLDLKGILNEYIYLNKNNYPKLSND